MNKRVSDSSETMKKCTLLKYLISRPIYMSLQSRGGDYSECSFPVHLSRNSSKDFLSTKCDSLNDVGKNIGIDSLLFNVRRKMNSIADNRKRPFVTLAYASTLNGMIAARSREISTLIGDRSSNLPISSKCSLVLTHGLRSIHDAVLVGWKTALVDEPRLTVRLWKLRPDKRQPSAVVLDTQLRILSDWKCCRLASERVGWGAHGVIICCGREAAKREARIIRQLPEHWTILPCDLVREMYLDLKDVLMKLRGLGLRSVMVEGGSEVLGSFLRMKTMNAEQYYDKVFDCICATISTKILKTVTGGISAFGVGERKTVDEHDAKEDDVFVHLLNTTVQILDEDITVLGWV
uniref:Bacterial bifunctional deaminase-reductase C-terminal domain-containing protein n=1 Tax=Corethron hystrix TaxID=216773 RepID=A0A7S1FVE2_9STRA|mmetsp:Transcript_33964/g.78404  ORF Transcript_33964/g.78404 Transcript_33964/m.78404 type:complete len:349 (+) Transcript_33964:69-1115(+)